MKCSLPGDLEVVATVNTLVRAPLLFASQDADSGLTPIARDASLVLLEIGEDLWDDVFYSGAQYQGYNLSSFRLPFRLHRNMTFGCLSDSVLVAPQRLWRPDCVATMAELR